MEVSDEDKAVIFILHCNMVFHCAEIVSQMRFACWLNAGENSFFLRGWRAKRRHYSNFFCARTIAPTIAARSINETSSNGNENVVYSSLPTASIVPFASALGFITLNLPIKVIN